MLGEISELVSRTRDITKSSGEVQLVRLLRDQQAEYETISELVFTRAIILSLIGFMILCLVFYLQKASQMVSLWRDLEFMIQLYPKKERPGPNMPDVWGNQDGIGISLNQDSPY